MNLVKSGCYLWFLCLLAGGSLALAAQEADDAEADQYFSLPGDFGASHILIAYKGADRAGQQVTRSKKEAQALAEELCALLKADPETFENLARTHSDGPTNVRGGSLGTFQKGQMDPRFESALKKLVMGEITAEPVKTDFGYHIIRRNPTTIKKYSARLILFTWHDAQPVRGLKENAPGRTREQEKALTDLQELLPKLTPANFVEMAGKFSDIQSEGGFMGVFNKGDTPLMDRVIESLNGLEYGAISPIVTLTIGHAVFQRIKVERLAGSQILISHIDADNSPENVLRIRKEALELAQSLCDVLKKEPDKFEKLAKKHSDDIYATRGGKLPGWYFGYRELAFDNAVINMDHDQITEKPVETPAGFYIIRRDRSE